MRVIKSWKKHCPNLQSVQTVATECFESSPLQNLKLYIKIWYWTKGKAKRPTELRAQATQTKE